MKRLLTFVVLAGCGAPPPPPPEPAPAGEEPRVVEMDISPQVEALGQDDIGVRARAEEELLSMGPAAEEPLRRALSAASGERRARIESILTRLEREGLSRLPTEGSLGPVRIEAMHAFAWQNAPDGSTIFVSTVWAIRNGSDGEVRIEVVRARVVQGEDVAEVAITGTKGEEPKYVLEPRDVKKPALKMPQCPPAGAGAEVFAVIEFEDGAGRRLKVRSERAGVEKLK